MAGLISTANLAGLISTANLANHVSTANLANLISTANLAGLVSTTYLTSQITSTVVGLGTTGYISSSQLVSTVAGISLTAGPTQTQVVSSINNLLVPYSTLNTTTYFQVKASSTQLYFGAVGSTAQIYVGDLLAANSNTVNTNPLLLIEQLPTAQPTVTLNYSYTGATVLFTIPAGVTSINVSLSGAGGGSASLGGTSTGGSGGLVEGVLPVTPGQQLYVMVGQGGSTGGAATFGGGGAMGGFSGASGGGRSAILNAAQSADLVTAGGGGGSGNYGGGRNGGAGGGSTGGSGTTVGSAGGGGGATGSAGGGGGGGGNFAGSDGTQYTGGTGQGGGGGGGYYGGGGGAAYTNFQYYAGGGGGSAYTSGLTTVTTNTAGGGAGATSNGSVTITYTPAPTVRPGNLVEIRNYQLNKFIIDPSLNVGINVSSITSGFQFDVNGASRAVSMSTQQLNISSINGQTVGGPIISTVIGLGTAGYISSSQLLSSVTGLVTGLGTTGYISSSQLLSSVRGLVTGLGTTGYISSSQLLSTSYGLFSTAITQTQITSSITNLLVPYSSLTTATYFNVVASTNQLFFGTYGAKSQLYIGDVKANYGDSVSTEPTVLIQQNVVSPDLVATYTFNYTGANQTFTVPAGLKSATVTLYGAGGANNGSSAGRGGHGGYVTGTLTLIPGETLTIIAGQGGQTYSSGNTTTYGGGGSSGGSGYSYATSGGGRSAIQRGGVDIVTAGGGGGNGYNSGGDGGGTTGGSGGGSGGTGGTQTTGGTGANSGTVGQGGNGNVNQPSGGGGGGYYGGGGGGVSAAGGGGGGSSYIGMLTGATDTQGGAGNGGPQYSGGTGGNGSVVISVNSSLAFRNANPLQIIGYSGRNMFVDANLIVTSPGVSTQRLVTSSIGVNCNAPLYQLDVNGRINAFTAVLSNGVALTSDRRIKTDITGADLSICYTNFMNLPLRRFQFISSFSDTKMDKHQIGFIADEISTVFPKSIHENPVAVDGFSTLFFVNYEQAQMSHYGATQYMASLLQQQASTIQALQSQIEYLMTRLSN